MSDHAVKETEQQTAPKKGISSRTRKITVIGMLSALAYVIMMFDFSVPFMPTFIKMDLSELPALIGAFALGPVEGVLVCLVKNLLHALRTTTGGVGELSNFILGASFVFTAGMIYKFKKNRKTAIIGSVIGALVMALVSIPSNYFITYPFYMNFMPIEQIIAAYQEIVDKVNEMFPKVNGHVDGLLQCLIIFNAPFTFLKGMCSAIITFLIYKKISPIIKGTN